ncbi:MAG TPA: hypothetical protein VGY54_01530 [Polyangiaceae bacterium]|nr:hypothetical protein [Polyangiaceae bacterium]
MPGSVTLDDLRAKYIEMLTMRLQHVAGTEVAAEARQRMARLAAVFPGSLREIDELALDEIRRRIEALDAVLQGKQRVEDWMEAIASFHSLARGALCAKRWLRGRKRLDPDEKAAYVSSLGLLAFPEDALAWADDLDRIASPTGGRLTNVVFARLARTLGVSERQARHLVFGPSRRERRRKSDARPHRR